MTGNEVPESRKLLSGTFSVFLRWGDNIKNFGEII